MVRLTLIIILVSMHCICGIPDILTDGCWWEKALCYSLFHANWWHLAVNALAIWSIYNPLRPIKPCRDLVIPFIIAVAVWPLALRPVIGISNMLYAVIGLRTPSLRHKWWRQPAAITFLLVTVAMLFIPRFSAVTHIAAFALGVMLAALHRSYLNLTKDARRYL